jgi:hypothetical protein
LSENSIQCSACIPSVLSRSVFGNCTLSADG